MRIEFTGRATQISPEMRALAERKLRKLERVLHGITGAHVVLATDKHRQIAEVSVHSKHLDLTAAEESADAGLSLGSVLDKLTRQAQRRVGKLQERRRRGPGRPTAVWSGLLGGDGEDKRGPRVIRSRRFVVKPMTVDEAILEVGAAEEGLVVFRNAATERVSVLFRRKDGNLGLIEPEA